LPVSAGVSTVPGMSGTFPCPWCGTSYPMRPVLVGRTVRCTTCRNAFALRADGQADRIGAAEATAAPALATPPLPPPPPAELATRPTVEPARLDIPPVTPPPSKPTTRRTRELNAEQIAAQRTMASSLNEAMAAALETESAKREADAAARAERKAAYQAEATRRPASAVLTGDGEFRARESRRFWWWTAGVVAGLALAATVLLMPSELETTLNRFTAVVPNDQRGLNQRIPAIKARAWAASNPDGVTMVEPFIKLGGARFSNRRTVAFNEGVVALRAVAALTPVAQPAGWCPATAVAKAQAAAGEADPRATLAAQGIEFTPLAEVRQKLTAAGIATADADLLLRLIRGRTGGADQADASAPFAQLVGDANGPIACELIDVSGRDGLLLMVDGNRFASRAAAFSGCLLRLPGGFWRVAELREPRP
jgi:hypothetical protein